MDTRKLATTSLFAGGILSFTIAIAPPMDAKVNYRLDDRTGSSPSWLVPAGAEFKSLEPGYGALKFPSALLGTALMGGATCLARKFGAEEELRQKLKKHRQQVTEHQSAAQAAYEMALTQQRYQTLLQADQVAFEGEVEQAYLESIGANPNTVHQAALPGTSLDQTINPGDKVREAGATPAIHAQVDAIASKPESEPGFLKAFIASTGLAWGNQGSGKSWFVRYLAKRKVDQGYRLIVFDPNSNRTEWQEVELVNTYPAIEAKMRWYVDEVQGRYAEFSESDFTEAQWREQLWQQGKAISVICEEATTYGDFIEDEELLATFVKVATTLSRKQEMPVTFVAHNNTQSCLGNIKGLANLIKRMQQIQLLSKTDPETTQPVASGKALVKLDSSDEWVEVEVPKLKTKIVDFRHSSAIAESTQRDRNLVNPQSLDPEYFERLYNLEFNLNPPTVSPASGAADNTVSTENSDSASDSGDADTVDTYPDPDWLPTQKQLLGMLKDTNLPAGRFIKETLKATKPERYRTAKQAIAWVVRQLGDFKLIEKFKDLLD